MGERERVSGFSKWGLAVKKRVEEWERNLDPFVIFLNGEIERKMPTD